jgi:hypothetical protein
MAFRFRKSIKLGPVKLNITKNGVSSVSLGGRGASLNIPVARSGGIRGTVGIPGSGLSMSHEFKQAQPVAIQEAATGFAAFSQACEVEQNDPWARHEQRVADRARERFMAQLTAHENAVAIAEEMGLPVPDFIPSQEGFTAGKFIKGCFAAAAIGIGCLFFTSLISAIAPNTPNNQPSATPEQVAADLKAMQEISNR